MGSETLPSTCYILSDESRWGRKSFLLLITYSPTNLVYPFTEYNKDKTIEPRPRMCTNYSGYVKKFSLILSLQVEWCTVTSPVSCLNMKPLLDVLSGKYKRRIHAEVNTSSTYAVRGHRGCKLRHVSVDSTVGNFL